MHRVSTWQRRYEVEFRRTLAIFCCDGRFTRYADEFLERELGLPGADWLVVPGGPAALGRTRRTEQDTTQLLAQVRFLVRAHSINRIILIFHADCAWCEMCRGKAAHPDAPRKAAAQDALAAAALLRRECPGVRLEAWWQHVSDNASVYESLPIG